MDEGAMAGAAAEEEEEVEEEEEEGEEEEGEEEEGEEDGEEEDTRAFGALSFDEEKHAALAKAHSALAAKCRWETLLADGDSEEEIERARLAYDIHWEELGEKICFAASQDVVGDAEVVQLILRIPDSDSYAEALRRMLDRSLEVIQQQARDSSFLSDRELVMRLAKIHGAVLALATGELCAEKSIVMDAVKSDATALKYASEALQADRDVVLAAMGSIEVSTHYGSSWPVYMDIGAEELWDDKEVVLAAIDSNPYALYMASEALRHDREVVLTAVRLHTARLKAKPDGWGGTILGFRGHGGGSILIDQEVVLEAVKVDGSALRYGSEELKRDKDFLLQAMRNAGAEEEQHACYNEAHESIRRSITFEECLGAASSVLAVPGEQAPVLNISLGMGAIGSSSRITSCDVCLLSGTTFTCCLSSEAPSADLPEMEVEPPHKRPKHAGPSEQAASKSGEPEQTQPSLTVAQLAKMVLEEFPRHVEVDPLPERVFIVVAGEADHVAMTPWDWNRPLPLHG